VVLRFTGFGMINSRFAFDRRVVDYRCGSTRGRSSLQEGGPTGASFPQHTAPRDLSREGCRLKSGHVRILCPQPIVTQQAIADQIHFDGIPPSIGQIGHRRNLFPDKRRGEKRRTSTITPSRVARLSVMRRFFRCLLFDTQSCRILRDADFGKRALRCAGAVRRDQSRKTPLQCSAQTSVAAGC
jgi:hypothetical protein